jgi:hypothetical protein
MRFLGRVLWPGRNARKKDSCGQLTRPAASALMMRYALEGGPRMSARIAVDRDRVADFCRKWKVTELALFGSVLRDDFSPESDVDVLVTFGPDARWTFFDLVDMEDELAGIFGRKVDVTQRKGLRNPFRRHHILRTKQVLHVA